VGTSPRRLAVVDGDSRLHLMTPQRTLVCQEFQTMLAAPKGMRAKESRKKGCREQKYAYT